MRLNIGIDVSKDKLDICVLKNDEKLFFTIINNKQSILDFIDFLKMSYKNHNFYFGYEATNNYSIQILIKMMLNLKS